MSTSFIPFHTTSSSGEGAVLTPDRDMPVKISAAPTAANVRGEHTAIHLDVSSDRGLPYPDRARMGLDLGLQAPDAKDPLLEHPPTTVGGQS
jgi:hypothetical protein